MMLKNTVTDPVLIAEIQDERLASAKLLAKARISVFSAFFLFHLAMAWGFGKDHFRGKEDLFIISIALGLLSFIIANRGKKTLSLAYYSIALIDLPITKLIVERWLPNQVGANNVAGVIVLSLSFMIFFVALSGIFFNPTVIFFTTLCACVSAWRLFAFAEIHPDIKNVGYFLLILSGLVTWLSSQRIFALLQRTSQHKLENEKLSRYFTPNVAQMIRSDELLQNNSERDFEVSVLFTDIRDFTRISSSMSGREIVEMLNEVHEHLVGCIFKAGGTLDKYLGDGIMAYFGAPVANSAHADQAISCALLMRDAIKNLNKERRERGHEPLVIGIGIHSGSALVGDIGAEIRREFTAIGDTVNTASRIESLTKKYHVDILLTQATRHRLKEKYPLRALGDDIVRGKGTSIQTFTID